MWQNILDTQVNVPKRRKSQYAFTTIIGNAPHILWQNILDTQVNVPYTADNEKQVLINFTICSLLHDICKAGFYKVATKNVKNDATGVWGKIPFYSIEDNFPYGHGEKSVFLIERFMRLTIPEAMAIRWHMGGFDDSAKSGSFAMSAAFDKFLLCVKLHIADLEATYIMEHGTSEVRR